MSSTIGLFDKLKSQVCAGQKPVPMYWLVRQHGNDIVRLITEGGTSVEKLGKKFGVAYQTIKKAIEFLDSNMALVAKADWSAVEDLIFAESVGFRNSDWYKNQVAAGYEAFLQSRQGKPKGGVPKGTKFPDRKRRVTTFSSGGGQGRSTRNRPTRISSPTATTSVQGVDEVVIPVSHDPVQNIASNSKISNALIPPNESDLFRKRGNFPPSNK